MAMITTIHGDMDEELLTKKTGSEFNEDNDVHWTEYWYKDELVHRSVHLHIKQGVDLLGEAAVLN